MLHCELWPCCSFKSTILIMIKLKLRMVYQSQLQLTKVKHDFLKSIMLYYSQTKFKHGWTKSAMVLQSVSYMPIDPNKSLLTQRLHVMSQILNLPFIGMILLIMMPILMFYFWVGDPTAYEHDDLFGILGVSQLLMIYMYIYVLCWAWTLKHMIYEIFFVEWTLKHMIDEMFFVERKTLEHMNTYIFCWA